MKWPSWINSRKFRACLVAILILVIVFVSLSHSLANKAKGEFGNLYGNLSQINGSLVCDQSQTGNQDIYDVFYKTRANPESYLVGTAQKKGYSIAADLSLINMISKQKNPSIPYSRSNFYLTGTKQQSRLDIRIFQAGTVKISCSNNQSVRTNASQPMVEVKVTRN